MFGFSRRRIKLGRWCHAHFLLLFTTAYCFFFFFLICLLWWWWLFVWNAEPKCILVSCVRGESLLDLLLCLCWTSLGVYKQIGFCYYFYRLMDGVVIVWGEIRLSSFCLVWGGGGGWKWTGRLADFITVFSILLLMLPLQIVLTFHFQCQKVYLFFLLMFLCLGKLCACAVVYAM